MVAIDHSIKKDERGEHLVVFPVTSKELIPPRNYEERLEWIRISYETFFLHVREKDSVREFCNKA